MPRERLPAPHGSSASSSLGPIRARTGANSGLVPSPGDAVPSRRRATHLAMNPTPEPRRPPRPGVTEVLTSDHNPNVLWRVPSLGTPVLLGPVPLAPGLTADDRAGTDLKPRYGPIALR